MGAFAHYVQIHAWVCRSPASTQALASPNGWQVPVAMYDSANLHVRLHLAELCACACMCVCVYVRVYFVQARVGWRNSSQGQHTRCVRRACWRKRGLPWVCVCGGGANGPELAIEQDSGMADAASRMYGHARPHASMHVLACAGARNAAPWLTPVWLSCRVAMPAQPTTQSLPEVEGCCRPGAWPRGRLGRTAANADGLSEFRAALAAGRQHHLVGCVHTITHTIISWFTSWFPVTA